jgi:sterol desaturase/sphingolipid hydroxylase (fatty acid hydroxylase superfamily)
VPEFVFPHLPALLNDILRLCISFAVLCSVFIPLERLCALHRQKVLRQEAAVDIGYYFLNGLLVGVVLSAPLGLVRWGAQQVLPGSLSALLAALPIWQRAVLALVVGEVGYYWGHRLSHEIPFLWRFHAVHHSAREMDFWVNSRAHPVDLVISRMFTLAPIYGLGIANPLSASDNIFAMLILAVGANWSYLIHANVRWRLGRLEWLITSPAFHHWHHTRTGAIDHNYATMLPWMDRIFGTHYLPRGKWPEAYGITAKMPGTLPEQLVYPLFSQPPVLTATRPQGAGTLPNSVGADGEEHL